MITYRTESRIVSGNDGGVLGDVLGRLIHRRLRLGRLIHRRLRLGRLVHRRLGLGRLIHRRRLGRLVPVLLVLRRLILGNLRLSVVILTTAGSNRGSKRRSGRHDLNETHICGINEGQEDPKFEKLLS